MTVQTSLQLDWINNLLDHGVQSFLSCAGEGRGGLYFSQLHSSEGVHGVNTFRSSAGEERGGVYFTMLC